MTTARPIPAGAVRMHLISVIRMATPLLHPGWGAAIAREARWPSSVSPAYATSKAAPNCGACSVDGHMPSVGDGDRRTGSRTAQRTPGARAIRSSRVTSSESMASARATYQASEAVRLSPSSQTPAANGRYGKSSMGRDTRSTCARAPVSAEMSPARTERHRMFATSTMRRWGAARLACSTCRAGHLPSVPLSTSAATSALASMTSIIGARHRDAQGYARPEARWQWWLPVLVLAR